MVCTVKRALPEPKIQANDSFITRGQDLNVNCTVELELSMDCDFDWHTPQKVNYSYAFFKEEVNVLTTREISNSSES